MQTYTTQMDAARKGIITPQMQEIVGKRSTAPRRSGSWWPKARWPSRPTSITNAWTRRASGSMLRTNITEPWRLLGLQGLQH